MIESSFLAGKVTKRSLPKIEGRPGPDAPRLKRLMLPQGELSQVYDGENGLRYLALVELRTDCVRGNHFHNVKEEGVYIISGQARLAVEDPSTKDRSELELQAGDLAWIVPGVAHALRTVEQGFAVEFSPTRFDPGDVHAYSVG